MGTIAGAAHSGCRPGDLGSKQLRQRYLIETQRVLGLPARRAQQLKKPTLVLPMGGDPCAIGSYREPPGGPGTEKFLFK